MALESTGQALVKSSNRCPTGKLQNQMVSLLNSSKTSGEIGTPTFYRMVTENNKTSMPLPNKKLMFAHCGFVDNFLSWI